MWITGGWNPLFELPDPLQVLQKKVRQYVTWGYWRWTGNSPSPFYLRGKGFPRRASPSPFGRPAASEVTVLYTFSSIGDVCGNVLCNQLIIKTVIKERPQTSGFSTGPAGTLEKAF
jgi:hypothetical protein